MNSSVDIDDISETLRTFIGKFIRSKTFKNSDNIFEAGFVNSMFVMELIMFVEKEFSLTVDNTELKLSNFASVDAMCGYIQGKLCRPCAQAS